MLSTAAEDLRRARYSQSADGYVAKLYTLDAPKVAARVSYERGSPVGLSRYPESNGYVAKLYTRPRCPAVPFLASALSPSLSISFHPPSPLWRF